ncbi:hypothetical protein [Falsirhodobacter halotolerans]|uniref:hypothetical protein n=1 Tax=Falsirhodobacter halotolerans TaxID=1146892 RepID=UPI001FD141EC|nr:hypothetical protein [Falsirhodobacter halotolerans]MCJ8140137.1 hypothetical protein [Falsirhodobacter halotolerans]
MTQWMTTVPTTDAFEARLSRHIDDLTRRISPARRARLRWTERMSLVRAIAAQGLHRREAEDAGDLVTLRSLTPSRYRFGDAPHPDLMALVRSLARQAAEADLAAQRSASVAANLAPSQGDPA